MSEQKVYTLREQKASTTAINETGAVPTCKHARRVGLRFIKCENPAVEDGSCLDHSIEIWKGIVGDAQEELARLEALKGAA